MRVIENPRYDRITFALRVKRTLRVAATKAVNGIADAILRTWSVAFPMPPFDPTTPPPIAKAQALREGARLTEFVDAETRKRA
jgi:hypothetical protein